LLFSYYSLIIYRDLLPILSRNPNLTGSDRLIQNESLTN
jgi:hypothetical protein